MDVAIHGAVVSIQIIILPSIVSVQEAPRLAAPCTGCLDSHFETQSLNMLVQRFDNKRPAQGEVNIRFTEYSLKRIFGFSYASGSTIGFAIKALQRLPSAIRAVDERIKLSIWFETEHQEDP